MEVGEVANDSKECVAHQVGDGKGGSLNWAQQDLIATNKRPLPQKSTDDPIGTHTSLGTKERALKAVRFTFTQSKTRALHQISLRVIHTAADGLTVIWRVDLFSIYETRLRRWTTCRSAKARGPKQVWTLDTDL